jgi:hypothetical protein
MDKTLEQILKLLDRADDLERKDQGQSRIIS